MTISILHTATGATIGNVSESSPSAVQARVVAARSAQSAWESLGPIARGRLICKLRDALLDNADAIARLLVEETGKTLTEAHAMEVLPLLEACDTWAARAAKTLADQPVSSRVAPHKNAVLRHQARGVVGIICPWNFPLAIGGSEMVMALMAGNAVVLKPSPMAPLALERFVSLAHSVGIPADVVTCVHGGAETGRALIHAGNASVRALVGVNAPELVDYLAFTGSTAVGREVAATCGEQLIPCRVELGGKACALVLDDADIERAATAIAWGAFCNSGQVCAGVQRVFVDDRCATAFAAALVAEISKRRSLSDGDPENEVGFLRLPSTSAHVAELLADAEGNGGRAIFGTAPEDKERRGHAVVVADAGPAARIWREECFGPLLAVTTCDGDAALIDAANASPFGLMASVFSENGARADRVATQLKIANVMTNDVVWAYGMSEIPWFGRKASGIGFSHGDAGLLELCSAQVVHHERARVLNREPFWYPYSKTRLAALRVGTAALYRAAQVRDKVRGGVAGSLSKWTRKGRSGENK